MGYWIGLEKTEEGSWIWSTSVMVLDPEVLHPSQMALL